MKEKQIGILIISIWMMLTAGEISAMGSRDDIPAMKPAKIIIADGEYLKYRSYVNGEISEYFYTVSKVNKAEKYVKIFYQTINAGTSDQLPSDYSKYNGFISVSLETGSMIEDYDNQLKSIKKYNKTGIMAFDLKVDPDNEKVNYEQQLWDGYELKRTFSKVRIKKEYPVYNSMAFIWVGMRFLDIMGGGILLLVEPFALKEAIPCYVRYIGKETIETPAGKFNTIKIGFTCADPFLGKLLDAYAREGAFWVEDSPRALVIKAHRPGVTMVLESISNI